MKEPYGYIKGSPKSEREVRAFIEKLGDPIGGMLNKWRRRRVHVYEHSFPNMVWSVGWPIGSGPVIVCEEHKDDYRHIIGTFTHVYE